MMTTRYTSGVSYGASFMTLLYSFLDAFTRDEWAAIGVAGGLFFAALTWATNVYFQRRRERLMERQNGDKEPG
ncbi:TPA: lysis protein [Klebsiella oxytoca]|uniref:Lysis protein n=1 Tax=Klebsiella oxytoca TaxID=571 RepID=A0AAN5RFV1_KLEOX|nr:lysis protein [Klebsiella oxytoca]